jgi:hypothetical protein
MPSIAAAPWRISETGREHGDMKFILVNHRTPLDRAACIRCSRSLGPGYLRDVSTQRPYCDYDCYLRSETERLYMPWLALTRADTYVAALEMIASFAAASCRCSISLAEAAMRAGDVSQAH